MVNWASICIPACHSLSWLSGLPVISGFPLFRDTKCHLMHDGCISIVFRDSGCRNLETKGLKFPQSSPQDEQHGQQRNCCTHTKHGYSPSLYWVRLIHHILIWRTIIINEICTRYVFSYISVSTLSECFKFNRKEKTSIEPKTQLFFSIRLYRSYHKNLSICGTRDLACLHCSTFSQDTGVYFSKDLTLQYLLQERCVTLYDMVSTSTLIIL